MLIQVWLVGSDSVFDAALRRLPEGYLVRALADWSEVISALRAEGADPVVVFDPYGETGELDPGMLGVRAEFPSVALVAAMHVDSRSAGDVLTHINEQRMFTRQQAMNFVASSQPGELIRIRVTRANGSVFDTEAMLEERPPPPNGG